MKRITTTSRVIIHFLAAFLLLLVWGGVSPTAIAASIMPTVSHSPTVASKTIVGDQKKLGNGSVRTWVKVAENGKPLSLGVTLTEAALEGLPDETDPPQENSLKLKLMDGGPDHTYEYELKFPEAAVDTAFAHMGFNWNPKGHAPKDIFDRAHFDVHFYMATTDYRHSIETNPQDPTKFANVSNIEPSREFIPSTYALALGTAEPRMGSHYVDFTSPQMKPGNFANIFLFGAHDGNMLFWEPMITLEYLKTKPKFYEQLQLPESYPVSGYYPKAYSVIYDENRKEIDIALEELTFRMASYPKNVYGVDPCVKAAKIIAKYGEVPPGMAPATAAIYKTEGKTFEKFSEAANRT